MCDIICIIQDITSSHFDLKPPFWGHHTQYIRHHVHGIYYDTNSIDDITATICMISHPVYVRQSVHYINDIIPTIYDNTTLCLITPHSAYEWHDLRYRRRHIYSITPSHNLYDFTSTSGMTSHPLYQTLHQLYICHHKLSSAITPTFVWHHTHYMCDIICTIYYIISTSYVITLLYLWQHKLDIWIHIQYAVQNIHYPLDITVTSVCHHTNCFQSITPTLYMTSY